jgi:hypothetical protein
MRDIGVGLCIGPIVPPLIATPLRQFQRLFIVFKYFSDLINSE